jgi:hypothetical protein
MPIARFPAELKLQLRPTRPAQSADMPTESPPAELKLQALPTRPAQSADMPTETSPPELKPMQFRLTRMTIDQLDALAGLPECGSKTAVIRQAVAEFFETKFPAGVPQGVTPIRKVTMRQRKK